MRDKDTKGKQGLASIDPEKAREIRRLGGQTAHRLGKAHIFTSEEAREAGKKGGRAISRNRAHMAKIGRGGATSPRRQRAKAKDQNRKET
ncbi:MAG: stress-induced protein [Deltaproteobacteria bacterium]|nr:stress-induced protein [Deltaproteobacteria bacterium]